MLYRSIEDSACIMDAFARDLGDGSLQLEKLMPSKMLKLNLRSSFRIYFALKRICKTKFSISTFVDIYTRFLPYEARVAVGVAGRETVEVSGSSNQ